MTPQPVIIDCDPGLDDAVNLLVAFASPNELDVLGVTVVAGNVGLDRTVLNARMVRELAGRPEIPVFAGCTRPLVRDPVEAASIHGETGMGGFSPLDPGQPVRNEHAIDYIARTLGERPEGTVSMVATGPLTNIAVALVKSPSIAGRIREIVLMGGARREGGNITPSAEFNFFADPHAAHVVFASGVPIVAMGLDVTHQVRTRPNRLSRLPPIATAAARQTEAMWQFSNTIQHDLNEQDGAPLHDPCTCAYLLSPRLFSGRDCHIDIVTDSGPALGHSAVDYWHRSGRRPNATWIDGVDADGVFDLIYQCLGRL